MWSNTKGIYRSSATLRDWTVTCVIRAARTGRVVSAAARRPLAFGAAARAAGAPAPAATSAPALAPTRVVLVAVIFVRFRFGLVVSVELLHADVVVEPFLNRLRRCTVWK